MITNLEQFKLTPQQQQEKLRQVPLEQFKIEEQVQQPTQEKPRLFQKTAEMLGTPYRALAEASIEGAKGLGSSVVGLGQMFLKGASKLPLPQKAQTAIQGGIQTGEELKQGIFKQPESLIGKIARTAEQVGEFMIPVGGEVRALAFLNKILPKAPKLFQGLAKMIGGATEFAGKTAIQTGGEPKQTGISGAIGAVSPIVGKVAEGVQKATTQILPERLMSIFFKTTEDDLRAMYRTISKGEELNPTLAREVLERGFKGNPQTMAVTAFQKLDSLEKQVQQTVIDLGNKGKNILLENKKGYLNILKTVRDNFKGDFMTQRATNAQNLINELNQGKGNNISVDLALRLRRFIDTMRNTSSFRLNPNIAPKQEGFKSATDLLRRKLGDVGLKPLMNEERINIEVLDNVISDAAKRMNRNVLGLFDLIAGGGGMASGNIVSGIGAGVAVRLFQQPFSLTNIAQALYKMSRLPNVATGLKAIPPLFRTSGNIPTEE